MLPIYGVRLDVEDDPEESESYLQCAQRYMNGEPMPSLIPNKTRTSESKRVVESSKRVNEVETAPAPIVYLGTSGLVEESTARELVTSAAAAALVPVSSMKRTQRRQELARRAAQGDVEAAQALQAERLRGGVVVLKEKGRGMDVTSVGQIVLFESVTTGVAGSSGWTAMPSDGDFSHAWMGLCEGTRGELQAEVRLARRWVVVEDIMSVALTRTRQRLVIQLLDNRSAVVCEPEDPLDAAALVNSALRSYIERRSLRLRELQRLRHTVDSEANDAGDPLLTEVWRAAFGLEKPSGDEWAANQASWDRLGLPLQQASSSASSNPSAASSASAADGSIGGVGDQAVERLPLLGLMSLAGFTARFGETLRGWMTSGRSYRVADAAFRLAEFLAVQLRIGSTLTDLGVVEFENGADETASPPFVEEEVADSPAGLGRVAGVERARDPPLLKFMARIAADMPALEIWDELYAILLHAVDREGTSNPASADILVSTVAKKLASVLSRSRPMSFTQLSQTLLNN